MALTPLDIHNKEFSRRLRGYDEDEVNEFLDQVIKDYELLIRENKETKEELEKQKERLDHFKSIEDTLSRTIIVAQETADEVKHNSKKEAQLIIKEAEKNADRIINESLSKSRRVAMDTEELKKQATIYRTRFVSLLEAQLELLKDGSWDTLEMKSLENVNHSYNPSNRSEKRSESSSNSSDHDDTTVFNDFKD